MANGYNTSTGLTSKNLVRHKRADNPPEELQIKYHNDDGKVESVTLKKVKDSTLFNSKVLIRNFEIEGGESEIYRLEHVQPIFYHGWNSFTAITYFPHTNTLHGVIDNSYYIEDLPLTAAKKPEIVDAFIHKVSETNQRQNHRAKRTNDKRKFEDDAEPSSSKRFKESEDENKPKKTLYPEILLTVDVSSRMNEQLEYPFEEAIMYTISYWNAVDMLFRQLKRVNIRINIAGIFIGMTQDVVFSMLEYSTSREDDSYEFILDELALDSLGRYFFEYDGLRRDSFDFLIWMTR